MLQCGINYTAKHSLPFLLDLVDKQEFKAPLLMFKHPTQPGHVRVYNQSIYHHQGKKITRVLENDDSFTGVRICVGDSNIICVDAEDDDEETMIDLTKWTKLPNAVRDIDDFYLSSRKNRIKFHGKILGVSREQTMQIARHDSERSWFDAKTDIPCTDLIRLSQTQLLVANTAGLSIWELNCPIRAFLSLAVCKTGLPLEKRRHWEPRLIGHILKYVVKAVVEKNKNERNKKRKREDGRG